ncbi:aldo/keto reductase [Rhizobium sp. TRM95796]|uniref:aldo/keto reductase n=1 Tax=Rhizobium sp. TRM95796 TaxID=2979862 RepID=UPI0021E7877B|nr:aldo/keto reductase [Rhizobium sp. TRM95796]MCV3764419.1 aldo/keto reductase [Rhizobium sp. TRM95796]
MKSRQFSRTPWSVSEIGFGAWAIGGSWGDVAEGDAKTALHAALDAGMTFIDTADVYGDGCSEKIIRDVLKERGGERPMVATKAGRRLNPHVADGYTKANIEAFIDRSLTNLGVETLDLVQLHCPPTEVYYRQEMFAALDELTAKGKIRYYGVSVEKVEEALKAIEFPNVVSVQIIYNIFRQRPADLFFREAKAKNIATIIRVPLSSGMLTGKMSAASQFASDDHRAFNRNGEAFDMGETFSGVPYEVGLAAVERLRPLVPGGATMAQFALRWILMNDAVTVVIPGAKNEAQAEDNAQASALPALSDEVMAEVKAIYDEMIAPHVHQKW